MAHTAYEIMWIKSLLANLRFIHSEPMKMRCDNQAAIYIVNNPVFYERMKYIEVDCHFIHDAVMSKKIATISSCHYIYIY